MTADDNVVDETPREEPKDAAVDDVIIYADRRRAVLEQKQYVTGKVSETCRFIGFGLIAVFYALIISSEPYAQNILSENTWIVRALGACGALAVFLDYIQYLAGDRAAARALKRDNDGADTHLYNRRWISYRIRNWSYAGKQFFALVGSIMLVFVMVKSLF